VAADARPDHLRQPGHIFPVMAQPGGVLTRAGHTEAGCDLARLAGLAPAAVIVEIMNDDGTMARRPQLEAFARLHGLRMGTIRDLIRYRLRNERTVERIAEKSIATEFGAFRLYCYEDHVNRDLHLALARGALDGPEVPLVRVHLADTLRDLLGVRGESRAWTLRAALEKIATAPAGVLVILREPESPRALVDAIQGLPRREEEGAGAPPPHDEVLRTYGIGAQILKDLGVRRMRVLSAPKHLQGISAFDLEVAGYVDDVP
jgi:3,4-dihydroxy 2-butanone 4-phosphate synthase/GTP cyclohydrolase II